MDGLTTTAGPDEEPVTLDEAKEHLRVGHDDEDGLISRLVSAARLATERYSGRRWVTQQLRHTASGWPCDGLFRLPAGPVQSVEAVGYYDDTGVQRVVPTADWQAALGVSPAVVGPGPGLDWPDAQAGRMAAVSVDFTAGYGDAAEVPADAKAAILLCVGYWYEGRGDDPRAVVFSAGLPAGAKRLLDLLGTGSYL